MAKAKTTQSTASPAHPYNLRSHNNERHDSLASRTAGLRTEFEKFTAPTPKELAEMHAELDAMHTQILKRRSDKWGFDFVNARPTSNYPINWGQIEQRADFFDTEVTASPSPRQENSVLRIS